MKIHQKYCELPIAATGAAASATNTTQMTVSMQLSILNFFFSPICQAPFSFGTLLLIIRKILRYAHFIKSAHFLYIFYEAFLIPYLVVNVPWTFAMPFSTQPLLNISVFPEIEKRLLCFTA